jgi:ParB family chromosome partitioning protein
MSAIAAIEERVQQLPIAHVSPSPRNPRGDVGDVAELAESIKAQGILEPLIVTPTRDTTSPTSAAHLALLKKAGYRPNAIDRKLARARGRR